MPTALPVDDSNHPIQALTPAAAQKFATSGTTNRSTQITADTKIVMISCTKACYYKLGGSGVTATTNDHYLPADTLLTLALKSSNYIAAIQVSEAGSFHITEMA